MNKTKANFRGLRELLGLTQTDLAEVAEVTKTAVKNWERPGTTEPPEDVWRWLLAAREQQRRVVDEGVSAVVAFGGNPQITIYRSQGQYDELGRDDGPVGAANANALAVADRLESMGYAVRFSYPDDADNIYHNA